jgi:MerR family transcriptional regulator, redox-sensitive transcriptional activator SoxR
MGGVGEPQLPIGAVAERTGVPASTLRFWEDAGVLDAPERVGGKRRYDEAALRRVEVVVLAKQLGFSLAEAKVILRGLSGTRSPSAVWRDLAARRLPEVERTLREARTLKTVLEAGLRCECVSLEECLAAR